MQQTLVSSSDVGGRVRVLQLFSRYRNFGGEEGSVYRIGDALHQSFDVGFFLTSSADAFSGGLIQQGLSVMKAFSNWSVVEQLKRYQELGGYNVWLIHNVFPAMSPAVYELAFELKVPVVHYLHNYRMGCVNGFFMNQGEPCQTCMDGNFIKAFRTACWQESHLKSGIMGMITAKARGLGLFHRVSHWIAISDAQKREHVAMGIPEDRITSIPHFYESGASTSDCETGVGDALFVGRLSAEKGVDRLILAWSLIQDCGRTLWIVGDGPERSRLEAMVREGNIGNVRFTGFLNHQQMAEIWAKSACSIVPSVWKEPFGMVVLEAWAKGRPVVAHRIGALSEIIKHEENGLLVSENSPPELAEAILSLLNNPTKAAEMGRAGSEKLAKKYCKNLWLGKIEKVLLEAATNQT